MGEDYVGNPQVHRIHFWPLDRSRGSNVLSHRQPASYRLGLHWASPLHLRGHQEGAREDLEIYTTFFGPFFIPGKR